MTNMVGDTADMTSRLRQVLPAKWFGDDAPNLQAILTGLASAWSGLYGLLQTVKAQARIATANGVFLDMAAADYFGSGLPRRAGERDSAYSLRIRANLIAPKATRQGLVAAVTALTGRSPIIFEPQNAYDTGGYSSGTLGYNALGGYGSLGLPYQFFVTAFRPNETPISNAGGYGVGPGGYGTGLMFYADVASLMGTVSDSEIYAAISNAIPTTSIAWTTLSN
jgi:hypothetical protein